MLFIGENLELDTSLAADTVKINGLKPQLKSKVLFDYSFPDSQAVIVVNVKGNFDLDRILRGGSFKTNPITLPLVGGGIVYYDGSVDEPVGLGFNLKSAITNLSGGDNTEYGGIYLAEELLRIFTDIPLGDVDRELAMLGQLNKELAEWKFVEGGVTYDCDKFDKSNSYGSYYNRCSTSFGVDGRTALEACVAQCKLNSTPSATPANTTSATTIITPSTTTNTMTTVPTTTTTTERSNTINPPQPSMDFDLDFAVKDTINNTVLLPDVLPESLASVTWCGWFKSTPKEPQEVLALFSYATAMHHNQLLFGFKKGAVVVHRGEDGDEKNGARKDAKILNDPEQGWHHYCLVSHSTRTAAAVWEDGVLFETIDGFPDEDAMPVSATTPSMISLGQDLDDNTGWLTWRRTGNENFQGLMTRVSLWGEKLSDADIELLYQAGPDGTEEPELAANPVVGWIEFAQYAVEGVVVNTPSDIDNCCQEGKTTAAVMPSASTSITSTSTSTSTSVTTTTTRTMFTDTTTTTDTITTTTTTWTTTTVTTTAATKTTKTKTKTKTTTTTAATATAASKAGTDGQGSNGDGDDGTSGRAVDFAPHHTSIVIGAGVVSIAIVLAAVYVVKYHGREKKSIDKSVVSYENPMYDHESETGRDVLTIPDGASVDGSVGGGVEGGGAAGYMDIHAAGATGAAAQRADGRPDRPISTPADDVPRETSGYMSVTPGGAAAVTSGYMTVTPGIAESARDEGAATSGYMAVAANTDADVNGGDDGVDQEEEV